MVRKMEIGYMKNILLGENVTGMRGEAEEGDS